MKFSRNFTRPEEEPIVPERLAERITNLLPHATKIDIMELARGGWRVINSLHLEGGEAASEVYTMVKAAADHHAMEIGHGGKYRAQIWRMPPGKSDFDRHVITFRVHDRYEDEEAEEGDAAATEVIVRRDQNDGWIELSEQKQKFIEFMERYNRYLIERMIDASRASEERFQPMTGVMTECIGMFRDGLRMKADSVRELGDLRVKERLAEARSEESSKMWEVFGPAIQVAASQFQHRVMGRGAPRPRALPPGVTTNPPRRAAPPTSAMVKKVHAAPASPQAPPPTTTTQGGPHDEPAPPPFTLHELGAAVLEGMGVDRLMKLMRMLDEHQTAHLEAIASARDDDTSAEAVAGLMQSLMANPSAAVAMQQMLDPDQLAAFQQIAMLARRHLDERMEAATHEAAPPDSGDAASLDVDDADE